MILMNYIKQTNEIFRNSPLISNLILEIVFEEAERKEKVPDFDFIFCQFYVFYGI